MSLPSQSALKSLGFVAWSQKAGVWQVQPPPAVLADMMAVRVHLDDCGGDNGPLRRVAGSASFLVGLTTN